MKILGIETSCDETAAAVVEDGAKILSNQIASQVEIHARYGGVVPEVASRQHILSIIPVIEQAMAEAVGPAAAGSSAVGAAARRAAHTGGRLHRHAGARGRRPHHAASFTTGVLRRSARGRDGGGAGPTQIAGLPAEDRPPATGGQGALQAASEAGTRIKYMRKAIVDTPGADPELLTDAQRLEQRLNELLTKLRGDVTRAKHNEPAAPSILERVEDVAGSQWNSTTGPTQTQRDAYRYAGTEFAGVLADLRALIEEDLTQVEARLEAAGAPWTPGRIPTWHMEEE